MVDASVLIVIHRRPEQTRKVLREIARAQPRRLFVAADAPSSPDQEEACRQTRAVLEEFDWKGEVVTDFADEPMGLRRRAVSAIDWVFEHSEEALIFEDDTVPHPDFFPFCTELLDRYREERRVMLISGSDLRGDTSSDPHSYRFSRYPGIWGWATWRRAWSLYEPLGQSWATLRQGDALERLLGDRTAAATWRRMLDPLYPGESFTWDHQWVITCWAHDGLSVAPNVNLVTNIGFGPDATNFVGRDARLSVPGESLEFPLRHPPDLGVDARSDHLTFRNTLGAAPKLVRLLTPLVRRLPMPARQAIRRAYARASR